MQRDEHVHLAGNVKCVSRHKDLPRTTQLTKEDWMPSFTFKFSSHICCYELDIKRDCILVIDTRSPCTQNVPKCWFTGKELFFLPSTIIMFNR